MRKLREKSLSCYFVEFSTLVGLLMLLLPAQCFAAGEMAYNSKASGPVWQDWQTVGYSTLTWGFWEIYDAQLKTPSGLYRADKPFASNIALLIDYRRNISKKSLLSATDEQWMHLGVSRENRKRWIQVLDKIWRDVEKGDRLVFVLTETGGRFYFGDEMIGRIDDLLLARAFVDIWLSESTAYPGLRRHLIGLE